MRNTLCFLMAVLLLYGCGGGGAEPAHGPAAAGDSAYTCPMPQDSVFAAEPGKCPKCGMELVKNERPHKAYTCPMHPEVTADEPGRCPKCGMDLVEHTGHGHTQDGLDLDALLKPTDAFVISTIPLTAPQASQKNITVKALGVIDYDTRQTGNISARVSGRIEKLYVRYRFEQVAKGQKVMDIYSPELLEAQQNLLFLMKNDTSDGMMMEAAKQKLLLLGMGESQLRGIMRSGKPDFTVSVYSHYSGHIHEAGGTDPMAMGGPPAAPMADAAATATELSLKEGMYVQKGQPVFTLFNADKAWVSLNIYSEDVSRVKVGQGVTVVPEAAPDKAFEGKIGFVEPFFRPGSKTVAVRVYFDNSRMRLPVGSQVKAQIATGVSAGNWVPEQAVISLGLTRVVFKKVEGGFTVHEIATGNETDGYVEVLRGILPTDSIAQNAQYLMDSESFVRVKKQ